MKQKLHLSKEKISQMCFREQADSREVLANIGVGY